MTRKAGKKTKRVNKTRDELLQAELDKSLARAACEEPGYLDALVSPGVSPSSSVKLPRPAPLPVSVPAPSALEPLLLTVEQTCQLLGISRAHFFRLKKAGVIPAAVNLGGLVRYRRADIEKFVKGL
jgi:excisionase family DNA binding protein